MQVINKMSIVLIPKKKAVVCTKDYHPISLYNVLYKIIAKTVANHMKVVLNSIIGDYQSAFVPHRMIYDNVIFAQEIIYTMKKKKQGKFGSMALKIDMSKAYDIVEWVFLKAIKSKIDFPSGFINLVMSCINSVSYSNVVNGSESASFIHSRGLLQGDPLSSYLFLLCGKGLANLLLRAKNNYFITGLSTSKNGPQVTHLFFADDFMLFCRVVEDEIQTVKSILEIFDNVTGQQVNFDKSSILFILNINTQVRDDIMSIFGITKLMGDDPYLGLSLFIERSKKAVFRAFKEKLAAKTSRWSNQHLSLANKAILLQLVAQTILTYHMCCFKFPKTFLHELNMIITRFWWGGNKESRKIHWKNCDVSLDGGLGLRDFEAFNIALLVGQWWRIIHHEDTLVYRVLKARYFSNSSPKDATVGSNYSYLWKSLLWGRDVINEGAI